METLSRTATTRQFLRTDCFQFHLRTDWPPLAWYATWTSTGSTVEVHHGRLVEVNDEWFGEMVWNGDHESATFHATDIVYGSGCRSCVDGSLHFVSSGMTTDRLQWAKRNGRFYVSNSLACLLATIDESVDAGYTQYGEDFKTVIHGYRDCVSKVRTSGGEINLIYYRNLLYADGQLVAVEKPRPYRDLSTYQKYRDFLTVSLEQIASNMRSPTRKHRYEFLGTISSGFDSPTVTALAKNAGLEDVITMSSARGGASDSGESLARQLGVRAAVFERDAWRRGELVETSFIASDAKGEDVYIANAEELLSGRVLLTGFAAGAWNRRQSVDTALRRADQSGLSMTEYRLHAGFIHIPVPPMGSLDAEDQHRMMWSKDMDSWCTGRKYDKPFCRRVLTEAGVPESDYGTHKKAASVLLFDRTSFLAPASLEQFNAFIEKLGHDNPQFRRIRQNHCRNSSLKSAAATIAQRTARTTSRIVPWTLLRKVGDSLRLSELASHQPLFDFLFPWALGCVMDRYRTGEK